MAYYGPRKPPGSHLKLLSPDLPTTMDAVRQTVLDLRLAAAWLESRPEVDGKRLGILGTSLGSFVAALAGEMEPKLGRVALLLGGGGFIDGYYDHPKAADYRKVFEALGGSKALLKRIVAPIDPITRADRLADRKLLMLEAKRDDIVPPSMGQALWEASGKQEIHWWDCTHFGAALYFADGMEYVVKHFGGE
jgi:dienelactone hydrolase